MGLLRIVAFIETESRIEIVRGGESGVELGNVYLKGVDFSAWDDEKNSGDGRVIVMHEDNALSLLHCKCIVAKMAT